MIFVTVGTHEQGLDRLLIELDRLIEKEKINEDVFAQIGYSSYKPKNYAYKKMIKYAEMDDYIKKASIVITHGGPGSIFHSLRYEKIPIVVPRNPKFNEHVDNHQILFTKRLEGEKKVIGVYNIEDIKERIERYKEFKSECEVGISRNNIFLEKFDKLIKVNFSK